MKPYLPTVFVIFGATGDLMAKKIAPALFRLYIDGKLPENTHIIGFARRPWGDQDFQEHVESVINASPSVRGNKRKLKQFLTLFSYNQGDFNNIAEYHTLAEKLGRIDTYWKICSNKLFYLAVPPEFYKKIFENLSDSDLTLPCGPEEGWTRILVEKPFGKDLNTAEELDLMLGKLFKEEQIYRIDHYLAKDMLQSILNFRFTNNLFESSWDNSLIESINIRLYENAGVEKRGVFYEGVGALRDVGQNHLLQMLALITMENPLSLDAGAVRKKRAEILSKLKLLSLSDIKQDTYRAQHDGYQQIDGVKSGSQTETFFKVKFYLDDPKFCDIPIIIESGKRMKEQIKEIVVTFRHPEPCMCPPGEHIRNKVVIRLEPEESIMIHFWTKKPGLENGIVERTFTFYHRDAKHRIQYVEEYEKLLLDCIIGNQLSFVSTDEVKASWKFIDPIMAAWHRDAVPLDTYLPDTQEAVTKSSYITAEPTSSMLHKQIGLIGLGKMGSGVANRLKDGGWDVVVYNRTVEKTTKFEEQGFVVAESFQDLAQKLTHPRIIWIMVTAGEAVDEILTGRNGIVQYLNPGDVVIDAGNSLYKDSIRRHKELAKSGIRFVDVGFSGGPGGALHGASLMVGGERELYDQLYPLYRAIATSNGVEFFEGAGAGHFVKMVHNGIEYGMMQAIGEGFEILKDSKYRLDLKKIASVYNHGSVIESRLIEWLHEAFEIYGTGLKGVSGAVAQSGEGKWTIETAKEMKLKAKVIEDALQFRLDSQDNPSYAGKIVSAMRNRFGGHDVKEKK